ncbi:PAS domain S-box protein [Mucilaginibacter sp. RS28]|uniref:histidine kinase n=1 Tax=Mucilaginibacter straminoryzae TaxID=2932774 RepID=A0A9X1X538_9SPHI|nr:PAS domain S-box protein [Mucilaginibacter straminoryzae]MCJ8211103.1 PAS domain S-box protein [Mucilaginibacter straminoryzae]
MKVGARRISAIYILVSLLWIVLSDKVLYLFTRELKAESVEFISSFKGFFFVLITGWLLYKLIKHDDQRLIDSEKQYRSIYEDNPLPMWIYSLDTLKFVSVNNTAVTHYGFSRKDFLNKTILDIRPEEDWVKVIKSIKDVTVKVRSSGNWRHLKADGEQIFAKVSSQQIIFNGKPHVMVTAHDVTDKVLFQNQLADLNQKLESEKKKLSETQQIAKLGGWEYYPVQQKLVFSEEMYLMTGLDPSHPEDLFQIYVDRIFAEDRPAMTEAMQLLLTEGQAFDVTHRIRGLDGSVRYIRQMARIDHSTSPAKVIGSGQDVTEIKELELERNQYQFDLQNTINNITEGFYTLDRELRFTRVNKKFEMESGMEAKDMIGKHMETVFPGIEEKLTYQMILEVLDTKDIRKFEIYSTYFNKWLFVAVYPTKDGVAVNFNDITEVKQKDEALKEALHRYNMVAKATQDVIYDFNLSTKKIELINNVRNLFEGNDQAEGDKEIYWADMVHPEDRLSVKNRRLEAFANQKANVSCEYRLHIGNGKFKHVYDQSYIIYDQEGKAERLIGAIKDIDALKRVSEENKRLADIITTINNMVLVTDLNHRITWVNKAFEDHCGYSLSELIGRVPSEVLGGLRMCTKTLSEVLAKKDKGEVFSLELQHHLKNGNSPWLHAEFKPLYDDKGKRIGYISVHQDITVRKLKEQQIQLQNQVLQEISWLSSHEIRRPVASLLGLTYLYKDTTDQHEKEHLVAMIDECAQDLDTIVHTITEKVDKELYPVQQKLSA